MFALICLESETDPGMAMSGC